MALDALDLDGECALAVALEGDALDDGRILGCERTLLDQADEAAHALPVSVRDARAVASAHRRRSSASSLRSSRPASS